ncbi:hypothetical protein DPMN_055623 [Dreissena polymorpha]|uniref:Uncharacterized protein n=1 Tax=Dreissena polymorpha TaxID=45954 RepID=A0A9D4CQA6_DREPO|nr:hypothetical protein DPMN_055623 [Dreissena polymorpha]
MGSHNSVLWISVLYRDSCLVTCPNKASFSRLTVAMRGSCGQTSAAVMFQTYSLVVFSMFEMRSSLRRHLCARRRRFVALQLDGDYERLVEPLRGEAD